LKIDLEDALSQNQKTHRLKKQEEDRNKEVSEPLEQARKERAQLIEF
jgi:hypothetical protein